MQKERGVVLINVLLYIFWSKFEPKFRTFITYSFKQNVNIEMTITTHLQSVSCRTYFQGSFKFDLLLLNETLKQNV